jgi:hypothetical protein
MNEASRDQRRGVTAPERYVTPKHELSVSQIFLSCLQLSVTELTDTHRTAEFLCRS